MERYKAVEYLFDCRTDRPSWDDDTVFWRDTGISEEVEDVEARDTGGMTMTDMMPRRSRGRESQRSPKRSPKRSRVLELGRQCLMMLGRLI